MTQARREILSNDEKVYHCISRCVRRAYLCGFDSRSGKNFDHRKEWLRDRLEFLAKVFVIDVLAYALMSTHQHTMLRTRPDLLSKLTRLEVARRWIKLYPVSPLSEVNELAIQALSRDKNRIRRLRRRLGNISWFMKSLNEYMARRANKEDGCKGRFWEGRFWCQRLEDEAAIMACAVYVDLNPIRAKVYKTPEESKHTSAFERINSYIDERREVTWLAPVEDNAERRGFLSITFPEYLSVLDESGKLVVEGKKGSIALSIAPILERLKVRADTWDSTIQNIGQWFSRVVGVKESLDAASQELQRKWLKGMKASKIAFR